MSGTSTRGDDMWPKLRFEVAEAFHCGHPSSSPSVTGCTSQRSPGTHSETLSECHFPLRAPALLPLIVLPLEAPTKGTIEHCIGRLAAMPQSHLAPAVKMTTLAVSLSLP